MLKRKLNLHTHSNSQQRSALRSPGGYHHELGAVDEYEPTGHGGDGYEPMVHGDMNGATDGYGNDTGGDMNRTGNFD